MHHTASNYRDRLDGQSCLVCGAYSSTLYPIPDVESSLSNQLFRCERCRITPAGARDLAARTESELAKPPRPLHHQPHAEHPLPGF